MRDLVGRKGKHRSSRNIQIRIYSSTPATVAVTIKSNFMFPRNNAADTAATPKPPPPRTHSSTRGSSAMSNNRTRRTRRATDPKVVASSTPPPAAMQRKARGGSRAVLNASPVKRTRKKSKLVYTPRMPKSSKNDTARWSKGFIGLHDAKAPDEDMLLNTLHWRNRPAHRTKEELLTARKKDAAPDMTFDIDGDGVVSAEDWTYARKFDTDGDGMLSEKEHQQAMEMMRKEFNKDIEKLRYPSIAPPKDVRELTLAIAQLSMLKGAASEDVNGCLKDTMRETTTMTQRSLRETRKSAAISDMEACRVRNERLVKAKEKHNERVEEFFRLRDEAVKAGKKPRYKSKREMDMLRKIMNEPDPSYDIDGDGAVSQTDYFFALRVDKDRDGVISAEEQETAWQNIINEQANKIFVDPNFRGTSYDAMVQQRLEKESMQAINNVKSDEVSAASSVKGGEGGTGKKPLTSRLAKNIYMRNEAKRREKKYRGSMGTKMCITFPNNSSFKVDLSGDTDSKPRTRTELLRQRKMADRNEFQKKLVAIPDFRIALGAL